MTSIAKVDQEHYRSLNTETRKYSTVWKGGKLKTDKKKNSLGSLAESLDKRCHWITEFSKFWGLFFNGLLMLRNIQNILVISPPKFSFPLKVHLAIGKNSFEVRLFNNHVSL